MTSRERVLASFAFAPTDRPAYDLMEGCVWPGLFDYFHTTHGCAEPIDVLYWLDVDLRWTGMVRSPGSPAAPPPKPAAARPLSWEVASGELAAATTVAEVEAYPWPDGADLVPSDCAAFRARWPDHPVVFGAGWQPLFWGACQTFGVDAAMTNLALQPALFEAAVDCTHVRYMERLRRGLAAARGHCDICWLGDDFASQQSMFVSPAHWRRYIKPRLAEQVALARAADLLVLYHSCGAVRPVLGDLIDIGVNGLLVFQTTAAGMEPEPIARDFGGRLLFYGGMDVQHLLSFGTPAEVEAEVHRNLHAFGKCGGYIVANSHHGVATINGANIEAVCRAAREATQLST